MEATKYEYEQVRQIRRVVERIVESCVDVVVEIKL